MIDYEKLKAAIELLQKATVNQGEQKILQVNICSYNGALFYELHDVTDTLSFDNNMNDIEGLIAKLKELTKPEPKFKLGDEVWLYDYYIHQVNCFVIDAIDLESLCYSGKIKGSAAEYEEIRERDIYRTREELIDSQIKHWQSLKEQEEKPRIYDVKSFVSSYNKACDAFINGILTDTDIEVDEKQSDYIHTHSTKCPKCSKQRVADGMCWEIGCDYKDCIHLASPYSPIDLLEPCRQKCIKCGEFY